MRCALRAADLHDTPRYFGRGSPVSHGLFISFVFSSIVLHEIKAVGELYAHLSMHRTWTIVQLSGPALLEWVALAR